MILSVSRRTDIPNYYSDWFYNRVKEGFLYVRNPMNAHQISKIDISPDVVDCIVFWTKNPKNMISRLDELKAYKFYFQFTLTGYGKDVEFNLPNKRQHMISVFQDLSQKIGREKVIWRYDPILLNHNYSMEYHIKAFKEIAENLRGYTDKVIISFIDLYSKTKRNTEGLKIKPLSEKEMLELAANMAKIASDNQMEIESCAEVINLPDSGIKHGSCIDKNLIEKIIGYKIQGKKDKNQREECGCLESVEVGTYNTCMNGCKYCYANFNDSRVADSIKMYDVNSPLLCGVVNKDDVITTRSVKSLKNVQLSLFDF
ncbi:DUF1848 domain-containing protein [Anaerocolumna aminovalerica]|uniref:DUF1848 domain-containing protein n=1 Tax=Anaerocolumna aminovalerica TaxID=1527 RepID=UPI000BE223E9|nr:DUF1848 domain-containing protein [Anaerocolumna aminovalerica]